MVSLRTLSTATVGAALVVLGTVGSAQAAIFRFSTSASRFTPGVDNQGAWSATILDQPPNDNYFVGKTVKGDVFRNFFTFDLSSLREQLNAGSNDRVEVLSATLVLTRYQGFGNPIQTIRWFDVSTSAARLNRDIPSSPLVTDRIFNDLGTGDPYSKQFNISTTRDDPPLLPFDLNSNAWAGIEMAAENGGFFSIGGTLAPISLASPGRQGLFQNSSNGGLRRLVIEAELVPAEPSSRRGSTYSRTGSDEQNVEAQFSLVNATEDGQPIVDQEGANDLVGLFVGAIENYTGGFREVCINTGNGGQAEVCNAGSPDPDNPRYIVDSAGFPIFIDSFTPTTSPFDGDFRAEFFAAGDDPLLEQNPGQFSNAAIAYSILRSGETEPVFSYRLPLDIAGLDRAQAVNSLDYIIENDLLGEAQPVIITEFGPPFLDIGDNLLQAVVPISEPTIASGAGNNLVQAAPIPEPTIAPGALVALGAGLLLKRKMKRS